MAQSYESSPVNQDSLPTSNYQFITAHNQNVQVKLYTPAHQGIPPSGDRLSQGLYQYDVPFLTRERTKAVEQQFSQLYQTKHTFWLTGGGSQAVLTACALLRTQYQRVAIALNSHISVIHGLILTGLEPDFIPSRALLPTAEEVISALKKGGSSALLLTHPSYEGVTLDIAQVANYCRQHNIACLVDESHGSHFPFLGRDWQSAIELPVDIVTHSLHKYSGSLVQAALLHLPSQSRFTIEQVMAVMLLFETTTRSNLLLLSIEDTIRRGYSEEGQTLFVQAIQACDRLRCQLDRYGSVLTYDQRVRDPLKLYLQSDRASGSELASLLYHQGIDGEFADEGGLLLIFSFHHNQQDFQVVTEAFTRVKATLEQTAQDTVTSLKSNVCRNPRMQRSPQTAFFSTKETLPIEQAVGRISAGCIKKVPPGSPILIPGEEITDWHVEILAGNMMVECMRESVSI